MKLQLLFPPPRIYLNLIRNGAESFLMVRDKILINICSKV